MRPEAGGQTEARGRDEAAAQKRELHQISRSSTENSSPQGCYFRINEAIGQKCPPRLPLQFNHDKVLSKGL